MASLTTPFIRSPWNFGKLFSTLLHGFSGVFYFLSYLFVFYALLNQDYMFLVDHNRDWNFIVEKNFFRINKFCLDHFRCQHCRQRCKTSSDLFVHLQSCPEMIRKGGGINGESSPKVENQNNESLEISTKENEPAAEDQEMEDESRENDKFSESEYLCSRIIRLWWCKEVMGK